MFLYVPAIVKDRLKPFVGDIVARNLSLLSDEDEKTREVALRVCRLMIHDYADSHLRVFGLLISEGIFASHWRRRLSVITLIADVLALLHKALKLEAKSSQNYAHLQAVFNRTLMPIYILRADEVEKIRLEADALWKDQVDSSVKVRMGRLQDEMID